MMRTLLAIGLLAATALVVVPSATAWPGETCVGGYKPGSTTNECVMTGGGYVCVAGGLCPGAKVQVDLQKYVPGAFVQVGVGYGSVVCVQYSCA